MTLGRTASLPIHVVPTGLAANPYPVPAYPHAYYDNSPSPLFPLPLSSLPAECPGRGRITRYALGTGRSDSVVAGQELT